MKELKKEDWLRVAHSASKIIDDAQTDFLLNSEILELANKKLAEFEDEEK